MGGLACIYTVYIYIYMLAPGLPGRLQIYEGETPGFGKIEKFERAKTYFPTVIQTKNSFLF